MASRPHPRLQVNPETPPKARRRLNRVNTAFLLCAHLLAAYAVLRLHFDRVAPESIVLAVIWFVLCGLSITAGYHRLFAHGAFRAVAPLRAVFLFFGAGAVQNSALRWARDHRDHHAYTDGEHDPYSVRHGFWWAHVGWVLFDKQVERPQTAVADLTADPLVRWQDRAYLPIAILAAAVVPMLLGLLWGDPLGALFVAGFLRLVLQWQSTFAINSLAHTIGSRPWEKESTARDSFWLALFTLGEGYHNFHHRFPGDYRNGVRWYHFDPTKWLLWLFARFRLVGNLRRVSRTTIEKARALARPRGAA